MGDHRLWKRETVW